MPDITDILSILGGVETSIKDKRKKEEEVATKNIIDLISKNYVPYDASQQSFQQTPQNFMASGQLQMPQREVPNTVFKLPQPIAGVQYLQRPPKEITPYQAASLGMREKGMAQTGELARQRMDLARELAKLRGDISKSLIVFGRSNLSPTTVANTISGLEGRKAQINGLLADPMKSVLLDEEQVQSLNDSYSEIDIQLDKMKQLQGRQPAPGKQPTAPVVPGKQPTAPAGAGKKFEW